MKNHEDNERLRKELQRERERRHAIDAEAQRRETTETPPSTLPEMSTQNQHGNLSLMFSNKFYILFKVIKTLFFYFEQKHQMTLNRVTMNTVKK